MALPVYARVEQGARAFRAVTYARALSALSFRAGNLVTLSEPANAPKRGRPRKARAR